MKDLKKLLKLKALLPAVLVAVCAILALKDYSQPILLADAAHGIEVEKELTEESITAETKSDTESHVTAPFVMSVMENAVYNDGVYYGSGTGFAGEITVRVVIKEGKIISITITDTKDGDSFIKKASEVISSVIEKQSTNVDTVSGATFSSVGIIEAVRNALKQAVSNEGAINDLNEQLSETTKDIDIVTEKLFVTEDNAAYKDGTYFGEGEGFAGTIKVKVIVKLGKIKDIIVLESSDGKEYMDSASKLLKQIIKKQSTNVDTVSGATYSSTGLIKAVRDALKDAVIKEDSSKSENDTENEKTTAGSTENENEETTVEGKFPFNDGVYFGTGEGYRGEITVAVVIEDKTIRYILLTKAEDDEAFLSKAKGVIKKVTNKQSINVDVVSGATYSSKGILEAIENALAEAKRITNGTTEETTEAETKNTTERITDNNSETTYPQETSGGKYKDGTYTAEVLCSPDDDRDFEPYMLSVKLTLKNDIITSITDVKGTGRGYDSYNDWYIKRAAEGTSKYQGVVKQILAKGDLSQIDAVSGATCSSKAIIEAVKVAAEMGRR